MTSPHGTPEPLVPTPGEIAAAIVFLADDDPRIHGAARDRMLRWGSCVTPTLSEATEAESIRIRTRDGKLLKGRRRLLCTRSDAGWDFHCLRLQASYFSPNDEAPESRLPPAVR